VKIKQKELYFSPVTIKLTSKKEANALREMVDFFNFGHVEDGLISEEVYKLSVKISDAFTGCAIEIPLTIEEKKIALNLEAINKFNCSTEL